MRKHVLSMILPLLFLGCSQDSKIGKNGAETIIDLFWQQEAAQITVKTMDDQPIAGAQILIGDSIGNPFSGNFLTTDLNGKVEIPSAWTESESITIHAPGYVRSTYFAQNPASLTFKLRRSSAKIHNEVRGVTQGLPIVEKDGWVDFGLVMPAFSKYDLLAFNINNVISPQFDTTSALGQEINIPTNISLPKQSERYSLFTITLDKPVYRIYYGQSGVNRVFAARGRFPFKSTVDAIRGGTEYYELINDFKINGGAIRDIDIKSTQTALDMPTQELHFSNPLGVTTPQIRGDEIFLAIGLANQSGYLIPTDVKKAGTSAKLNINTLPGAEQYLLSVVKRSAELKTNGDRMSITLLPLKSGLAPAMLPLIPDPSISGDEILMPKFNSINGVNPLATYSILSREEEVTQGSAKVKIFVPQWEVYAHQWLEKMKIPQWPNDRPTSGKQRWEVNFVGSQTTSQTDLGPAIIDAATHVTHTSVTF